MKQFPDVQSRSHYYCTVCQSPLTGSESVCECEGSKVGRFITLPIGPQIKRMMEGMHQCYRPKDYKLCQVVCCFTYRSHYLELAARAF